MKKETYKYKCVQCDFFTNTKQAYERHIDTDKHNAGGIISRSDKKYPDKCESCDYKPTSNRSYNQHKLNFHSSKEERKEKFKYYCEKCDFGTFIEKSYNNHINSEKHNRMS
jgi:hypothetical protein